MSEPLTNWLPNPGYNVGEVTFDDANTTYDSATTPYDGAAYNVSPIGTSQDTPWSDAEGGVPKDTAWSDAEAGAPQKTVWSS